MKNFDEIKKTALTTIREEAKAIKKLEDYVDDDFVNSVKAIYESSGRVIITGIGKSAAIANKIVATFNSTGTPAIFMHAADAIHGDLGIIQKNDVIICISKSGNTPEIKVLIPLLKNFGNKIIAMVSNTESFLAVNADYVIKAKVEKEACPNNLAPTSSTTAQLVIGDALAVCLLECRGFSKEDFAKVHPGGALGKQLYMTVGDIFLQNQAPRVTPDTLIRDVIFEISSKRLGATAVVNTENNLLGVITDGDLRRMLEKNHTIEHLTAKEIMTVNPKVIGRDALAVKAFSMMENNSITQLMVVDQNKYLGVIHLHDILREGIV